jgi:hypothetical protein
MHTAVKVSHFTSSKWKSNHPFLPLAFDGSEDQHHIVMMEKESHVPIVWMAGWVQEPL